MWGEVSVVEADGRAVHPDCGGRIGRVSIPCMGSSDEEFIVRDAAGT